MKLYFSPGACSLAAHIVLREAGMKFELVEVSLKTHTLTDGSDYYGVNPKGSVPLLEFDDGARLTEVTAILQYIADHARASGLLGDVATLPRYRGLEWLNYISTELHKGFAPLFNPAMPPDAKALFIANIDKRLAWVDRELEGQEYLMGDRFSLADAYLFTVTNWPSVLSVDISAHKNLTAFRARIAARPAVQEAMRAEGLRK